MIESRVFSYALLLGVLCSTTLAGDLPAHDQERLERLVLAEAQGEGVLGMALVARSVLNRAALVQGGQINPRTYLARGSSVSAVINARRQYEPVGSGAINRRRSRSQLTRARQAIDLARDTAGLRRALAAQGVRGADADRLLSATGFRTKTAFRDRSQMYDRQVFRNHVFNADRFSRRHDVTAVFERRFGRPGGGVTLTASAPTSGDRVESALPAAERGRGPIGPWRGRGVEALQRALNRSGEALRVDGILGPKTASALQRRLNAAGAQLEVDGLIGPETKAALAAFQRRQGLRASGVLNPATVRALAARTGSALAQQLRQIMPRLDARLAAIYAPAAEEAMRQAGISTPAQRAAFLATVAYETRELQTFEDASDPEADTGGSRRARQALTNYRRVAQGIGLDLARSPSLAASPSIGFKVAGAHWQSSAASVPADAGDFREVTRLARWGAPDYPMRLRYYTTARRALGVR